MKINLSDEKPICGEGSRYLGVRLGSQKTADIPIDEGGCVHPRTGGMSVFDSPDHLPKHRKPCWMPGGEGRDPLFEIDARFFKDKIISRYTNIQGHALVEPAVICSYSEYATALCCTRPHWRNVLCQHP